MSENSVVGCEIEQFFRLAKLVPSNAEGTEAGDIGFIVDGVGCSQAENKPLEARSSFQTEPIRP